MAIRTIAVAALLTGLALPVAAGVPNAAVMATIESVLAAADADNASRLNSYFASSANVVDDFPPFAWSGADAGARWWTASDKDAAKHGIAKIHATLQPVTRFAVVGDDAYVIAPLVITYTVKGKAAHTSGLWTLTLHQTGGSWKITSATWAVTSGSP
jgi:Domain of unknown function (DUF4440)